MATSLAFFRGAGLPCGVHEEAIPSGAHGAVQVGGKAGQIGVQQHFPGILGNLVPGHGPGRRQSQLPCQAPEEGYGFPLKGLIPLDDLKDIPGPPEHLAVITQFRSQIAEPEAAGGRGPYIAVGFAEGQQDLHLGCRPDQFHPGRNGCDGQLVTGGSAKGLDEGRSLAVPHKPEVTRAPQIVKKALL
jgi:hypothetical protein